MNKNFCAPSLRLICIVETVLLAIAKLKLSRLNFFVVLRFANRRIMKLIVFWEVLIQLWLHCIVLRRKWRTLSFYFLTNGNWRNMMCSSFSFANWPLQCKVQHVSVISLFSINTLHRGATFAEEELCLVETFLTFWNIPLHWLQH